MHDLADDATSELVRRALQDVPGVATFTVRRDEHRLRVTYDATQVTPEAIEERLAIAGLVVPRATEGGG